MTGLTPVNVAVSQPFCYNYAESTPKRWLKYAH